MSFEKLRAWLGWTRPATGEPGPREGDGRAVACEEALAHVYELLDGELRGLAPEDVERHFKACAACYPHLMCERAFRDALRRAGLTGRCPESVRARILDQLGLEDASPG